MEEKFIERLNIEESEMKDNTEEVLDIYIPEPQKAVTDMPSEIRTCEDMLQLQHLMASYRGDYLVLYRGHEDINYKMKSTIVRFLGNEKGISTDEISAKEKIGFDLFHKNVFKKEWLEHKIKNLNEDFYAMSIGRHLGLPCRLFDVTASLRTAVWFAVMNPNYYSKDGELIVILLKKERFKNKKISPFDQRDEINYAHEPFCADNWSNIPVGEYRRFIQNGHFLWVNNDNLLNEEETIENNCKIYKIKIPSSSKISLAKEFYRDVYKGYGFESEIESIKNIMRK
ncbi:MAG TPA: FRG domain-containing protein [Paludibacteraceae bacterium]|nr:FRG domain-containing protein [Paludibacteraceae bacterium]HOU67951.1 FRG domain-containing protein [Paludibacteraceae bacterium]HPH63550.1 FRG domain-containing protein [Paludibacteraceae bacterium]HQF49870.1 FRG domain-containing protein [Paludibacteraceae bacterium]HQJ90789.1 FRG domain-containing protein [Paludibacteraceae bacterium]